MLSPGGVKPAWVGQGLPGRIPVLSLNRTAPALEWVQPKGPGLKGAGLLNPGSKRWQGGEFGEEEVLSIEEEER